MFIYTAVCIQQQREVIHWKSLSIVGSVVIVFKIFSVSVKM